MHRLTSFIIFFIFPFFKFWYLLKADFEPLFFHFVNTPLTLMRYNIAIARMATMSIIERTIL